MKKHFTCFVVFTILSLLCFVSTASADYLSLVDSFVTPIDYPQMALDFDPSNNSLWAIENKTSNGLVVNFDLSGNILSSFNTTSNWNNTAVAVNGQTGSDQRIYYFENLAYRVREANPDGTLASTTQLLWGYQNAAKRIEYDPAMQRVLVPRTDVASLSIVRGIDFVQPGVGITGGVDFDWLGIAGLNSYNGFAVDDENYWFLGSADNASGNTIISGIDRDTLALSKSFVLPDGSPNWYNGLAFDPGTGRFYSYYLESGLEYWGGNVDPSLRVFEITEGSTSDVIPEPSTLLLLGSGILLSFCRRRK